MVRRDFIRRTSALLGGSALTSIASARNPTPGGASRIALEPEAGFLERLAANELARGLANLGPAENRAAGAAPKFVLSLRDKAFKHSEAYEIRRDNQTVHLTAASAPALLYAVADFLERQGAFFGLDGEVYPLETRRPLELPPASQPWTAQPSFNTRGLLPFPDFLNCISVYNREDYRAALEAMARMRLNTLFAFFHSSGNEPQRVWNTESFLSFEYGRVGHWTALQTTSTFLPTARPSACSTSARVTAAHAVRLFSGAARSTGAALVPPIRKNRKDSASTSRLNPRPPKKTTGRRTITARWLPATPR